MDDVDLARVVAAKILLASPNERQTVARSEIPAERYEAVAELIPSEIAKFVDAVFSRDKRHALQFRAIVRTFLRQVEGN
ncbi:MAG: hypothetical protein ACQEW8_10710 [Actinomycetota bacterium]